MNKARGKQEKERKFEDKVLPSEGIRVRVKAIRKAAIDICSSTEGIVSQPGI